MDVKKINKSDAPQIRSILNQTDGSLPFGYFEPTQDGKLTWNCGLDPEGRIISVFCFDFGTHKDKKVSELSSLKDAVFARDELIKAGWMKLKPPEITVSYDDGTEKPLNRQQKRYLSKQLDKLSKNNPFENKDTQ